MGLALSQKHVSEEGSRNCLQRFSQTGTLLCPQGFLLRGLGTGKRLQRHISRLGDSCVPRNYFPSNEVIHHGDRRREEEPGPVSTCVRTLEEDETEILQDKQRLVRP